MSESSCRRSQLGETREPATADLRSDVPLSVDITSYNVGRRKRGTVQLTGLDCHLLIHHIQTRQTR